MLIVFILLSLTLASFALRRKTRHFVFKALTILFFVLLVIESTAYGYFLCECARGRGLFLIGNQFVLDSLYKFRLIYATYYRQNKSDYYYRIDDELGYSIGRNKNTGTYVSNASGIRADREYDLIPEKDVLRIACFGDSFVHCDGERNEVTWERCLEKSAGNLEVMNFGVGGYGLVQSYLRYLKDGVRFCPDIVISNYVQPGLRDGVAWEILMETARSDNLRQSYLYRVKTLLKNGVLVHEPLSPSSIFDRHWRNKTLYERLHFYKNSKLLSSPVLRISNIGLLLKSIYLKRRISSMTYGEKAAFLGDGPAGADYGLKVLENYRDVVSRNNGVLVFILSGDVPDELVEFFKNNASTVKYFNIDPYFKKAEHRLNPDKKNILNPSNHYNTLGNIIYASAILDILRENEWHARNRVFYYDREKGAFLSRAK